MAKRKQKSRLTSKIYLKTSSKVKARVLSFYFTDLLAQSVALVIGKPLLKVSVSDTGVGVTKAEQNLNTIFLLASAWEAVLLFDEADIPLEARAIEDNLARNSMVSLFLKVLEYYEGILFFTSNCIKIFDITV